MTKKMGNEFKKYKMDINKNLEIIINDNDRNSVKLLTLGGFETITGMEGEGCFCYSFTTLSAELAILYYEHQSR